MEETYDDGQQDTDCIGETDLEDGTEASDARDVAEHEVRGGTNTCTQHGWLRREAAVNAGERTHVGVEEHAHLGYVAHGVNTHTRVHNQENTHKLCGTLHEPVGLTVPDALPRDLNRRTGLDVREVDRVRAAEHVCLHTRSHL